MGLAPHRSCYRRGAAARPARPFPACCITEPDRPATSAPLREKQQFQPPGVCSRSAEQSRAAGGRRSRVSHSPRGRSSPMPGPLNLRPCPVIARRSSVIIASAVSSSEGRPPPGMICGHREARPSTQRMRSRRSHLDVRLGRVEMMISSKPPSRTHRSMAPNGSGPSASPWTGAPAAPSAAAKLHRASSRPSCDCSHRERAARTRTTRPCASLDRLKQAWRSRRAVRDHQHPCALQRFHLDLLDSPLRGPGPATVPLRDHDSNPQER